MRAQLQQLVVLKADAPAGGLIETANAVKEASFARPIRANEPDDLPLDDVERDAIQRRDPTKAQAHVAHGEQRLLQHPHSPLPWRGRIGRRGGFCRPPRSSSTDT